MKLHVAREKSAPPPQDQSLSSTNYQIYVTAFRKIGHNAGVIKAIPNCFAGLFFQKKGVTGAWQRMRTIVKVELAFVQDGKCFDKAKPTSDKAYITFSLEPNMGLGPYVASSY